uniref:Uncharacterized protein n=1 Tax=mine drainage metagenome TaxID=410659 RepID=E6QJB6_9ZZZZ
MRHHFVGPRIGGFFTLGGDKNTVDHFYTIPSNRAEEFAMRNSIKQSIGSDFNYHTEKVQQAVQE